jgi:hypothetical protein
MRSPSRMRVEPGAVHGPGQPTSTVVMVSESIPSPEGRIWKWAENAPGVHVPGV